MKCEYWIALGWIVAYVITVTCVTLWPVVLIILIMISLYGCCILKYIFTSMSVKDWLNKNWIFVIISIVLVSFFILWNNGVICIHAIANANSKADAELSYNIVNTISGILTPLLSFLAVVAAFLTLYIQRRQNEIEKFENHLFQMIDQQHKLEEKVIAKHGSFRELYEQFCEIYDKTKPIVENKIKDLIAPEKKLEEEKILKEVTLKISYYIFYFGADESFMFDKTKENLIHEYNLRKDHVNELIKELDCKHDIIVKGKDFDLFHYQKSEQLGIYYRNLFNAIWYIDNKCPIDEKKEEYAKLVRTQISDFAQLMLYYNMQGKRGEAWLDDSKEEIKYPKKSYKVKIDGKEILVRDCLLTRYKPIKNCAISKDFDYDIDPRKDSRKELFSKEVIHYELEL